MRTSARLKAWLLDQLRWLSAAALQRTNFVGILLLTQFSAWSWFLHAEPSPRGADLEWVALEFATIAVTLANALFVMRRRRSAFTGIALSIHGVFLLVGFFAGVYVSWGTTANWSIRLSHTDGLMIALGMLLTTGPLGIDAKSEFARRLLTTQLAIDVLAALVVFGVIAARLAERPRPRR